MKLRTGDFVAIAVIIVLAVAILIYPHVSANAGETVNISRNGEEVLKLKLSEDREIELDGMIIKISERKVMVSESDCHDLVCKKTRAISRSGEVIVCAPKRIFIEIKGDRELDAIAG